MGMELRVYQEWQYVKEIKPVSICTNKWIQKKKHCNYTAMVYQTGNSNDPNDSLNGLRPNISVS